jgi:molybdopterin synthase sulfur carrier subunit
MVVLNGLARKADPDMAEVIVRYWAAAKEAAGISEENVSAKTLSEAIESVRAKRPGDMRFTAVLSRSSFLVNESPVGKRDFTAINLPAGAVIEVLPAFAGG